MIRRERTLINEMRKSWKDSQNNASGEDQELGGRLSITKYRDNPMDFAWWMAQTLLPSTSPPLETPEGTESAKNKEKLDSDEPEIPRLSRSANFGAGEVDTKELTRLGISWKHDNSEVTRLTKTPNTRHC